MGYLGYASSSPRYYPHVVISSFFTMLTLLISFSTPHWLASNSESKSEFIRLGLWTVCFRQYRHHNHQFDQKFDGCHWIFGYKFRNIRNWLQPEWMVFVQCAMSCAVVFSVTAAILLLLLPVLSRKQFRRCLCVLATAFILESVTGLLGFLSVSVFGGMCFDRSWIPHPNYNYLSWSYILAAVSCLLHGTVAALILYVTYHVRNTRA